MKAPLLASLLIAAAHPASATEPYEGKWGPDLKSCRAEPTFTLTARTIDSPTFGCRQVAYSRAADRWAAKARQCYAEGEDKATSMTFAVLLKGNRMQIDWGKDGQSDWMVRCGP